MDSRQVYIIETERCLGGAGGRRYRLFMRTSRPLLLSAVLSLACAKAAPPAAGQASGPTAPAPPAAPDGAWRLAAKDALTQPEHLPELMGSYFDAHVLVSVTPEPGGLALLLDSADADGAPMGCAVTTRLSLGPLDADGAFSVGVDVIPLVGEDDIAFSLRGARIDGTVSATGLALSGITGTIDSGAFVSMVGASDRDALCGMVGQKIPCGPCEDGGETCWDLALAPTLTAAPPFQARSATEVCADPTCADRPFCGD